MRIQLSFVNYQHGKEQVSMKAHYDQMVRGIEEMADQAMHAQVLDKSRP